MFNDECEVMNNINSIFQSGKAIYIFLFLICTLLAKAQGHESYSVTCLSTALPIYQEQGKINTQKEFEQTVYWKKHMKLKKYAFSNDSSNPATNQTRNNHCRNQPFMTHNFR